jgi:hypothetical protein
MKEEKNKVEVKRLKILPTMLFVLVFIIVFCNLVLFVVTIDKIITGMLVEELNYYVMMIVIEFAVFLLAGLLIFGYYYLVSINTDWDSFYEKHWRWDYTSDRVRALYEKFIESEES